jgi:hypothetical protein
VIQARLWRLLGAVSIVLAGVTVAPSSSIADDKELTEATDFRVRVQAALRLGRQGGTSAKKDLENGLRDPHPAVRVACAVGLGNIGDAASIPPLEAAQRGESFASVKSAMKDAVDKLRGKASAPSVSVDNAKYVVQLGQMKNNAATARPDLDGLMRTVAKAKAGNIKNALILDSADSSVLERASQRKIPVLLLDGTLTRLTQTNGRDGGVIVTAQVDVSIRQVPKQTLKGTVSGNASASDDKNANSRGIQELQNRAVGGAVESAMSSVSSEIAVLVK